MTATGRTHTSETTLSAGTYTYYIKCVFSVGPREPVAVTFTVDTTPPSRPVVSDDSKAGSDKETTYHLNKLFGEWKSTDAESGIKAYNY